MKTVITVRDGKIDLVEIAKQGPSGPPGPKGEPGVPGTGERSIYISSNDPTDGDGTDGDLWFKVQ